MRWKWPFHRGDWVPLIPERFRWPILLLWAAEPIARGMDYITGDAPGTTQSLTFVEQAMPLQGWGTLCLVGGLLVLFGYVGRWVMVSVWGLHLVASTYAALAVGLVAKTIERGGDGFRTPVMFAVFAITFWLAALGYLAGEKQRKLLGGTVAVEDGPSAPA